jgi:hypothetical protein
MFQIIEFQTDGITVLAVVVPSVDSLQHGAGPSQENHGQAFNEQDLSASTSGATQSIPKYVS